MGYAFRSGVSWSRSGTSCRAVADSAAAAATGAENVVAVAVAITIVVRALLNPTVEWKRLVDVKE
jgi:hypothetical protein